MTRRDLLKLGAGAALAAPLLAGSSASAQDLTAQVAPGLVINRRAAWAGPAQAPLAPIPTEDVRFLLVHHTAGNLHHTADEVPDLLRGFYAFHTSPDKGWPDIAYNFMIDREGGVWETHEGSIETPLQGYATGGNQGFSQLVCLIGDFTDEMPSDAALDSLTRTLTWLADRDGIEIGPDATTSFVSRGSNRHPAGMTVSTPTINGHRSMSLTSCPGDAFFPYVESELPLAVAAGLGSTTTTTATTAPTSTTTTSTTNTSSTAPATSSTALPEPTTARSSSTATSSPEAAPAASGADDSSDDEFGWLPGGAVAIAAAAGLFAVVDRRRRQAAEGDGPSAG